MGENVAGKEREEVGTENSPPSQRGTSDLGKGEALRLSWVRSAWSGERLREPLAPPRKRRRHLRLHAELPIASGRTPDRREYRARAGPALRVRPLSRRAAYPSASPHTSMPSRRQMSRG